MDTAQERLPLTYTKVAALNTWPQFVFSSFGTAIPVPHQEDSGLDIYSSPG